MKQNIQGRVLAALLIFCLFAGWFHGLASAVERSAEEADAISAVAEVENKGWLQNEINHAENGQSIVLPLGRLVLTEPIIIPEGKEIIIRGEDRNDSIISTESEGEWESPENGLLIMEANSKLALENLTVDGDKKVRCISAKKGDSTLTLRNVTLTGGNSGTHGGSAILMTGKYNGKGSTLKVEEGCTFSNNEASEASANGGGTIYVGEKSTATLTGTEANPIRFFGNAAHSGACIYTFRSFILAEHCQFGVEGEAENHVSQRGGAIHDHGTVVLKDCTVTNNSSGQYGGGVYVSANDQEQGVLLLDHTTVTGNGAQNGGGGVFLTSGGSVYLRNQTSVTGNVLNSVALKIEGEPNNIYYSGETGMIVACDDTLGPVGISTLNPAHRKLAVLSSGTIPTETFNAFTKRFEDTGFNPNVHSDFVLSPLPQKSDAEAPAKPPEKGFYYDGDEWELKDRASDADAPNDEKYVTGNLWLKLDQKYIPIYIGGTGGKGDPYVVFDYNLPGQTAIAARHAKGTVLTETKGWPANFPEGKVIRQDGVKFTFLGWYTDALAGTKVSPGVAVTQDVVYYAHWKVEADSDVGSTPATGNLYLVYFDQNYPGGGFTASYNVAGSFTFEAEYTFENPETGEEVTGKHPIKVDIPWGWPGDPYREGYEFEGWFLGPTGGSAVNKGSWTPTQPTTTLYAHWTPHRHTLTWNSNGGSAVASTQQEYDSTVIPPNQVPTRTGYRFTGWYIDSGCTVPLTSGTLVQGNATFYAGWTEKEYLVTWNTNYAGGPIFTVGQNYGEKLALPREPTREGYTFNGWKTGQSGTGSTASSSVSVTGDLAYYAQWTAERYNLTWDANGGTGGGRTTQSYGETVIPPTTPPTRTGYEFTGWYLDENCTTPLTSGTLVTGAAAFYAGWTPKEYTITWDANYTGGTVTTIKQYHDEKLNILPKPVRDGYSFGGWYTQPNGAGTRAESYGTVREDVTFYAKWANETLDYTVKLEWDDQSNNDNVRPEAITVSLVANGIPTGLSYVLDATDGDASGNIWSYTFEGLDVTDAVSNPITYSVAITSTVSDQYSYGIENKSAELGYILMTHSLITRDVDTYVVWDDNNDQDGVRPATVSVRLFANGEAVDDEEAKVALSGGGNTWFYQFRDVQKYYTDAQGRKGQQISYTLQATATNPGELDGYDIEYRDYTIILRHKPATVSRSVRVEWQDNNDQDGKRPASMMVQLYADNVPLEGKVVLLSNANNWTHTWDDLAKYADGGREVTYSARVSSTLVDYTAKSTGMTIEMTYVPSSTSISAFVTWTDENDADGLRPDFVTAQLVADGKPTGDSQVLSAASGWTVSWTGYPIYKDGDRIEYTFQVDVPDGYEADYHGVYDTSGLSAVLTHQRLKQELTGNIVWEDRDNQSGGRMGSVAVLLYADGSVIDEDDKVWISAEDGWEHTFSDLPVYRDGGQEIKYSMVLVSDPGKYIPTTSKMTITMRLEPEYVDVPFQIIWDDNNDSDGARPGYVAVALLVDGKPSPYGETATAQTNWGVTFTHLDRYGTNGLYLYKAQLAEVPDGYTATYTSPGVVVLKRVAQTKDVTASVTWLDNNNQYRERPEQVTLTLYADRLDGNGPQNTGRVEKCKAADGWTFTFEDVPAFYQGKNILYSVVASGNLPNYTISYDGMEVFMRHVSYQPPVTVDYTAKVVWHDGHNAKGSRPYNLLVTLFADRESCGSYTMTEVDLDATGYTWLHTFTDLPTKVDGKEVAYTIGVTEPAHYIAQTQGNTITMTHVMDITVLVRWHDQRDNDGVRPEALTLELFGDSVKTDTSISLTGDHTAETWRNSFRQIPVWSDAQMDREIVYTWAFAGDSLTNSGYAVNYNEFAAATVGNEDLYPIDISRPGEMVEVPVSVLWEDDNDQDGLRPHDLIAHLYADGVDMGKSLTLTGGNEDKNWSGTFGNLPVWKDGQRVQYSVQAEAPTGYTVNPVADDPLSLSMWHTPITQPIQATVVWDETVKEKFDIAAELLVDGEGTGRIGVLDGENGYKENWGEQFVYRDHGQPIDYTVRVAEQTKIPEGHVIEAQGLTITVKRVLFQLTGHVYNNAKKPVPTALVTLISAIPEQPPRYAITDKDGYYSFTVSHGSYSVYATVSGTSGGHADAAINKLQNDTTQDLTLSGFVNLCNCTVKVIDSNGVPASGAEVEVARIDQGIIARLTMDHEGTYTTVLPSSSYDFQASHTTNQGICYRSDVVKRDIWGNTTITITVPVVDTDAKEISGTVLDADGKPRSGIVVQCYHRGGGGFLGVEAKTDENGNFILGGLSNGTYEVVLKDLNGQEINLPSKITFSIPADTSLNIVLPSGGQDPTPFGQGTLTGLVTDKNGQPVGNAQVVVTDRATSGTASILTTNPDGTFEVSLPTGEYTVEVWKPFDNNTDQPIRVDDDAASSEGGSVTADSFTISGYALDEGGQPMEGITVYLYGEDGQLLATASLFETEETALDDAAADLFAEDGFIRLDERVTAEDGKYVFKELPAGRYVVKIAHGGIGGNGGSTDIPVTAQPLPEIPDDADLTVTTDSYTVSGVVENRDGALVNGAKVTLLDEQGKEIARMTTGADGVYTFADLSEGDYTVNISYPDSELLTSGDVTISDGGFTAFPGQVVSGTVKDNKDNALANVTVTISSEANTYTATTDKEGSYRVVVPDGKYTVEVNINGKTASKAISVNGKAVTADLTIILSSGGDSGFGSGSGSGGSGGGFIPDPGPTEDQTFVLSGTVTDKDGNSVEGANVTATDAKSGKTYADTTGADGKYALAVPKGSYTITISYGSVSSNPKKVSVSKDSSLDVISMDGLGKLVYGYVTGYGNGTFGGGRSITRSEVAALISRVSPNFDKDKTYAFVFKDVAAKVWYANNLGYCVEAGLIQGRGNGMFDPNANITRAEFAAIVARFLGLPNEVTGENRYTDTSGNWAEGYIAQLTVKSIVEGKGDGKFDPNANISRYEAVTMLNRALERTPDKAALDALAGNRTIRPFPDLHPTHWAYHQVLEAAFDHYHK